MALQVVSNTFFPQIPDVDIVVDASRVKLVAGLSQSYGSERELGFDEIDGGFLTRVPELDKRLARYSSRQRGRPTPM